MASGNCFSAGGGGTTQESQSTSTNKTEEQKKALADMLKIYMPEAGKNKNVYQGDRVAPFSALQTSALDSVGNFTDYFSTPTDAANPLFGETGTALKGLLSGDTGAKAMTAQDTADYFKGAIYDPTMKTLREDVNPATQEAFSGPGFYGSARSQALQKNAIDTADTLNTNRANLNWNVLQNNQALEEAKAGRAVTAVGQGMQYSQLPAQQTAANLANAASQLGSLGTVFNFGQTEQTQEQSELQAQIAKFAEENQITDSENLQILLSLLGMNFSTTTSSGQSLGKGLAYSWVSPTGGIA